MKVGILYFTGTGVTGYVARLIAEGLEACSGSERGDKCEVELLRFKKGMTLDPARFDLLGFGAPTYSFFPPRIFYRFLKNLSAGRGDTPGKPFFLFNTSHHLPGITVRAMYRALSSKGWTLAASPLFVRGVNNIRAWRFPKGLPPPRDSLSGLPGVERLVHRLLDLAGENPGSYSPPGREPDLRLRPGLALFTALFSWNWEMSLVEGLYKRVDEERCTRCRLCVERICPAGAIEYRASGYPRIRNFACVGCSGCVNLCPEEAIFTAPGKNRWPLTKFRSYL